jgi:HEAT repeat protein
LKRQGADTRTQNVILRYLVRGAEENPEAVAAIMEYWSRPLSKDARIGAIEALGNADAKDPRIIDLVISSLDDPDFNVRLTAFQALRSLSPAAVQQARLPMQKAAREYVALVEQKDADPNVQVSAIEQLLLYEPNDPEVVSAVVGFYSRSLDFGLRTSVQNALRHIKNVRLVDLVTSISFR